MTHELAFTLSLKDGKTRQFTLAIDDNNKGESFKESLMKIGKELNQAVFGKDLR